MITAKELYSIYKAAQDQKSLRKEPEWDQLLRSEQTGWKCVADVANGLYEQGKRDGKADMASMF